MFFRTACCNILIPENGSVHSIPAGSAFGAVQVPSPVMVQPVRELGPENKGFWNNSRVKRRVLEHVDCVDCTLHACCMHAACTLHQHCIHITHIDQMITNVL